uniref:cytochrome c oxidase subunit II n=1 Tax=Piagetiella africana TaxID=2965260 RepID=UPI00286D377E|nr:cytochrome c oxidase subunit II [Piagetiella africana]WKF19585.1 cytochrome c oxidase subunit 2 [Piagetiella africana]
MWIKSSFNDFASMQGEMVELVYDTAMVVGLFVLSMISYWVWVILVNFMTDKSIVSFEIFEIVWTVSPLSTLFLLAFPSLWVMYSVEQKIFDKDIALTVKVTALQWYWVYEYSDLNLDSKFESYMKENDEISSTDFRLLEVTSRLVIPYDVDIRVLITSEDVIHSWSLPSLAIKMDAVPGRLNQCSLSSQQMGLFYGQCSEICGALHSFMPICVEITTPEFLKS